MSQAFALQLQGLSTEMQLLLALTGARNRADSAAVPDRLFEETDWNVFVDLATHHRVHPYLYYKLKDTEEKRVPPVVFRYFQDEYRRNTFQMLRLGGEMRTVDRLLAENGVRALHLKGPALAEDLYGDVSLRTSCDLDLLIPISDLKKAEHLLASQGFVKDEYIHSILGDWKWRHHHLTFHHAATGIKVELHWRLHPAPSGEPSFDELWARARTSSLGSQPIRCLGREDLFQFLVAHGARHGWSRLRWLLDIKQWLLRPGDASLLRSLLRKHGYYQVGGQALALAAGLLGARVPEGLREMAEAKRARELAQAAMFYLERTVNLHSPPVPEDVDRYHKRYLFALMSPGHKLRFVASFLYPYPEDAETLPLPKALHVLYFPLRPVLWAWRKAVQGRP